MTLAYAFLSLIFFGLGIGTVAFRRLGTKLFILGVLALPSSNAYGNIFAFSAVFYFEFYFLGALLALLSTAHFQRTLFRHRALTLSTLTLLAATAAYMAVGVLSHGLTKYVLRDMRPTINALEAVILFWTFESLEIRFTPSFVRWATITASLATLFWFSMILFGFRQNTDVFYDDNKYRFFDGATYFCALYIVYYVEAIKPKRLPDHLCLALATCCVLISSMRILFAGLAFSLFIGGRGGIKKVFQSAIAGIGIGIVTLTFCYVFQITRITETISNPSLLLVQFAIRFGPAIKLLKDFTWLNVLYGKGAGTTSDIEWFVYRGLDTLNNFIDTTYVTFSSVRAVHGALPLGLFQDHRHRIQSARQRSKPASVLDPGRDALPALRRQRPGLLPRRAGPGPCGGGRSAACKGRSRGRDAGARLSAQAIGPLPPLPAARTSRCRCLTAGSVQDCRPRWSRKGHPWSRHTRHPR